MLLCLSWQGVGFAQEEEVVEVATKAEIIIEAEIIEEIEEEQTVESEDLGIKEPKFLPSNPFYFLKDWWRDSRLAFTFNPVKKAELRQKITNKKLLEIRKMVENGEKPEILERAKIKYEDQQEKLQTAIEKLKEKKIKNPEQLEIFKDKFIKHQILHDKILEKLETQVPEQAFKKIKAMREAHIKRFKETMFKLDDKDKIPERLEKAFENIKGSELKNFKQLEFLKRIKESAEDGDRKEIFQQVEERMTEKFKEKIEQLAPERQERIKVYIKNLPGDKEKQLEILENIKDRFKDKEKIRERLEQGREKLLEKIGEKNLSPERENCPLWTAPAPGFCKNGRVIIKRDKNRCPLAPICINAAKIKNIIKERVGTVETEKPMQVCTQIWDPVCGENGKTYSNACVAKISGQKIAHQGVCANIQTACAKEGQRVNRNSQLGSTDKVCCSGLIEKRVSRSYSVCVKSEIQLQPIKIQSNNPQQ